MAYETNKIDVSVVVPTYNERQNVQPLLDGICRALDGKWTYEVIVVDDNSPDGTADVVRDLAKDYPAVRVVNRPGKLGLGSAVVDGFRTAAGDSWVMMDADLSHRPDDLPKLLNALSEADIVVGSRYIQGGAVENWPIRRRLASRLACEIGRLAVGQAVKDPISGFVAFRRQAAEAVMPCLDPKGFKLLIELLAKSRGSVVKEVPIVFCGRVYGSSKLSGTEAMAFLGVCWRALRHRSTRFNRGALTQNQ